MHSELIPRPVGFCQDTPGDYLACWQMADGTALVLEARVGTRTGQVVVTHAEVIGSRHDVVMDRQRELVSLLRNAADVDGATPDR